MFMAERGLDLAVRVSPAPPLVEDLDVRTPAGVPVAYRLLSVPACLVEELPRLLDEV